MKKYIFVFWMLGSILNLQSESFFVGENDEAWYPFGHGGTNMMWLETYFGWQSVFYPAEELKENDIPVGIITSIGFYLTAPAKQPCYTTMVSLHLANTDLTSPPILSEMKYVNFRRVRDYKIFTKETWREDGHWIMFDLDEPFEYTGEGLMLMFCYAEQEKKIRNWAGYSSHDSWPHVRGRYSMHPDIMGRVHSQLKHNSNNIIDDGSCGEPVDRKIFWVQPVDPLIIDLRLEIHPYDTFDLLTLQNDSSYGEVIGTGTYPETDNKVIISATPYDCYRFVKWVDTSGNTISTKATDTIVMLKDSILIAIFEQYTYKIELSTMPVTLVGKVNKLAIQPCGKVGIEVEIIDTTNCFTFESWKDKAGNIISTKITDTIFLMKDTTLTATFKIKNFMASISSNPTIMGTVEGTTSGYYNCNYYASSRAIPSDSLFAFTCWTSGKDTLSYDSVLNFRIKSDTSITANFAQRTGIESLDGDYVDIWINKIFPNPATNKLYIDIIYGSNYTTYSDFSVFLYNSMGEKVLDVTALGTYSASRFHFEANIDIPRKLPTGIYILSARCGNVVRTKGVVIINE
jgi:hypothetical protein